MHCDAATQMLGSQPQRGWSSVISARAVRSRALADGRSVDTSMGFTPLEGLMMARRSGSVDPGLLLYLLAPPRSQRAELDQALNEQSGLAGVSGVSADMREVLAAADQGNARAALARDMFVHRVVVDDWGDGGHARRPGRAGLYRRHRRAQPGHSRRRAARGWVLCSPSSCW